jgi:hypothetical protein
VVEEFGQRVIHVEGGQVIDGGKIVDGAPRVTP